MINVLILSAGRRVELVQLFQAALKGLSPGSKVVAGDMQALAPALYFADEAVRLPQVSASNYVDAICDVARSHSVSLIVPTIDPELPILSFAREEIRERTGAEVMIASPWVVDVCADKVKTFEHVVGAGLLAPGVVSDLASIAADDFPLIVKPRSGSSSIGVVTVRNRAELDSAVQDTSDPMVQRIAVGDEYTIDCFCDFSGNIVSVVPRLRIATRSGEIAKGKIVRHSEIVSATSALLTTLPMPGHSTVQCFATDRGVEFIEVNPRFGGGAPMSIQAGADSCSNLIRIIQGESLEYSDSYRDGDVFLRFDQSISLAPADVLFQ